MLSGLVNGKVSGTNQLLPHKHCRIYLCSVAYLSPKDGPSRIDLTPISSARLDRRGLSILQYSVVALSIAA
jgi:hypothetical protein